jgi:hypothetical protein
MMGPPQPYPRRRWWPVVAIALAVAVITAVVTGIVFAWRSDDAASHTAFTNGSAKAAIQQYLDALAKGDDQTVARHTLCGLFDSVKQNRSDLALASLTSDAFRKQYSRAEVTSIDKLVLWSPNQAQVLFTMKVVPARGSSARNQPQNSEEQGIAQLLSQNNEILVCSYLPRTAGQY